MREGKERGMKGIGGRTKEERGGCEYVK